MKKIRHVFTALIIGTMFQASAQVPSKIIEKSFNQSTTVDVRDVLLDKNGNAYCSGYSGSYYYVAKYNSQGIEQWRLNGLNNAGTGNNSYDFNSSIEDMAIDASGNLFFTGIGYNPALGNRLSLTKVSTAGVVNFSVIDTTVGFYTNGYRIVLDASGTPYVAGTRSELSGKIYVMKFNKNTGAINLAKVQDYTANQAESISDIALDNSGNIYISGDGYKDANSQQNIFTLKLNSAGNQVWIKDFDGNSRYDYSRFLYVNAAGTEIYNVGYSNYASTSYDWQILKYNAAGNQTWSRTIDGGGNYTDYLQSFAVDANGNPFAAGIQYNANNGYVYAIVKLNPANGNTTASATFGEPYSTNPIDIAIDSLNRIYALYDEYDVMSLSRFANNLSNQWTWNDTYNYCYASDIAVTPSGEAFCAGKNAYTTEPTKLVKTDASGNELWSKEIVAEQNYGTEYLYDYVTDNNGNIYAAGYAGETSNMVVYRLNRDGDIVWKNYFNTGAFRAYDIKLDNNGSLYVCGNRGNYMGLIKYNAATGARLWSTSFNAPGSGSDIAYELALDANNNIYITGKGYKNATEGNNIYTLKYNSNGVQQWAVDYTGAPNAAGDDFGYSIAVDASGNVYVGGSATVTNKALEFTVLKYNTNGVLQYAKLLSGANINANDEAYDVACDNAGNVYACGYYYSGYPEYYSGVIVKLNATGGVTFTKQYNGITSQGSFEVVNRLIVANNTIVGIGSLRKDATVSDLDMFVVKLTTAGAQSWIKYYDNTNNTLQNNYGYDVYQDAAGNTYTASISNDSLWTIIKYDNAGAQVWLYSYDRNLTSPVSYPNYETRPYLAADGYGGIYVGGTAYKAYSGYNHTFIRFCENPPVPAITASGPLSFCAGGSVDLTASSGLNYKWSNGAATQTLSATTAGNYTVTVTYQNGCSKASGKKKVTVNANPVPVITPNGPITFCDGGTVSLNAGSFTTYLWNNGATVQTVIANASATYKVTVTNANGCTGTSAQVATVVNPLPTATATPTGSTTFCAGDSVKITANGGAGLSYQWRKGANNVGGATAKIYYPKTQGSYTVKVTDANTCSKTSAAVAVTVNCRLLGAEVDNAEMTVYPNPTSSILHLQANNINENVVLRMYDSKGTLLLDKKIATDSGVLNYDIDLSSYSQGMYSFEIISDQKVLRKQAFKIE